MAILGVLLIVASLGARFTEDTTLAKPVVRVGRKIWRSLVIAAGWVILGTSALVSLFENGIHVVLVLFGFASTILGSVLVVVRVRQYMRWHAP